MLHAGGTTHELTQASPDRVLVLVLVLVLVVVTLLLLVNSSDGEYTVPAGGYVHLAMTRLADQVSIAAII